MSRVSKRKVSQDVPEASPSKRVRTCRPEQVGVLSEDPRPPPSPDIPLKTQQATDNLEVTNKQIKVQISEYFKPKQIKSKEE